MKRVGFSLWKSSSKLYFIYSSKLSWAAEIKLSRRHMTKKRSVSQQFLHLFPYRMRKMTLNFRPLQLQISLLIQLSIKIIQINVLSSSRLSPSSRTAQFLGLMWVCSLLSLGRPTPESCSCGSWKQLSSPFRAGELQGEGIVFVLLCSPGSSTVPGTLQIIYVEW